MKACVATGEKRQVECRDIPIPEVKPGWMLLKTTYASICGSDLEYLDGSFALAHKTVAEFLPTPAPSADPEPPIRPGSIPGHEFVAEVVEIGEGVNGWSVGERAIPLGHPDPQGIGAIPAGYENYKCMAEYFVSTPAGLIKVPDHMSNESAVMVEPLATGKGAVAAAGVTEGQSVVVIGAGKIGLLAAMAAKAIGASPVISVDLVQSRLDKALEVGADIALNGKDVNVVTEVLKETGDGADAILICVRDGHVLNQASAMAKVGASIVLAGFVTPMEVSPMLWSIRRLKIIGILGGDMGEAYRLISEGKIDPEPLISKVFAFDDCQEAIDSVYGGENITAMFAP
jgi:(R,R)-butanediol dehydrogenase/meso-butanediol dehydrogenase/diacetyl reductase